MKKLLMLILSLSMATVAFTSCGVLDELFDPAEESSSPTSSVETPVESTEEEKKEYTVTFQQAGQADVMVTVKEGDTLEGEEIPAPVQEEGYTTVWKAEDLAKLTNISGNVNVLAVKTANSYTITFEAGEGVTFPATKTVTYDAEVTLSAPERAGYIFDGWFIKDTTTQVLSGPWKVASDVTLTAKWTEMGKATITFVYADGTVDATTQVYVGDSLTELPNPQAKAKEGYSVDTNWYIDSACTTVANFENITASMMVYAKATANTYTITYNANGGTVTPATQNVVFDSNVTLAIPTRDNYTFNNWTDANGKIVTDGKWTTASNVTLTANWTEMGKATITFVYADGTTATAQVYVGGSLAAADLLDPTAQAVTGYTIDTKWYTDADCTTVASFDNITAPKTVYAKKTAKTYTVQLNADGGTGVAASFTVRYGEEITLDMPTKVGYTFSGWYNGDTFVAKDAEIVWTYDNDSLTLTAKWEAKTYKVTLNATGGSLSGETTFEVKYGESYELPTPTRDDAAFVCWKQNGTEIPTSGVWTYTAAGENVELKAAWKEDSWTQNY